MKSTSKSVIITSIIAAIGCSALADDSMRHYPHGNQRNYQSRGHDSGWIAPLLFLGLAGAVIGAAASQQSAPPPAYVSPSYQPPIVYERPAPIYIAPPVMIPAAPPQTVNAWYYCKSVGQYYPYTQYCPEGWQLVSPTAQ